MRRRLAIIGAALGLLPLEAAASAQPLAPVSAAGPDEILLQLDATGSVTTPADRVELMIPLRASGPSAWAARAAAKAKLDRIIQALNAHGIPTSAMTGMPGMPMGFVGNEAYGDFAVNTVGSALQKLADTSALTTLKITLTDPAQIKTVTDVLDGQNEAVAGVPIYSLTDDRAARSAAVAHALARVQQDAQVYASALGYRVVRIARVGNPPPAPNEEVFEMMSGRSGPGSQVKTTVTVHVDFILRR